MVRPKVTGIRPADQRSNDAQTAVSPNGSRGLMLSWGSMFRTCRAAVGLLVFTAFGVIIPSQTADMLGGFSDQGARDIWAGVAFHFALWLLAFNAWHWSRAVLSARFKVPDTRASRAALGFSPSAQPAIDSKVLVLAPRVLFCAAAGIGVAAAIRSFAWMVVLIIVVWTAASLALLHWRLIIQLKLFGKEDLTHATGPSNPPPSWIPAWLTGSWRTLDELVRHAPLGRRIAALLLSVAALLFIAGALETFLIDVSWWPKLPAVLGFAFPGPSAALLCLGLAIGPLTVLTYEADRFRWSGRFLSIPWQLRRPPVFTILLTVIMLTTTLLNLHGVRVVSADKASLSPSRRESLETMFVKWAAACAPKAGTVRPIVVALSGGASRAGLWGARVLREVDAKAAAGGTAIFAISSVSGGSLGAAAYTAILAGQPAGSSCRLNPESTTQLDAALIAALRSDALVPLLAGALFGDVPRGLIGAPAYLLRLAADWLQAKPTHGMRGGDRAEALERAFEQNWSYATAALPAGTGKPASFSQPFLSLFHDDSKLREGVPIWIANGTDAQNGGRVLTVPFDSRGWPFPGAHDALSLLGRDIPISTAIDNTARFPFLSPAGELSPVTPDPKTYPTQLIDGGYFDNSGLLTALDLARWLEQDGSKVLHRLVEPILVQATADADDGIKESQIVRCGVQLDDDSGRSIGTSRPIQFLAPFLGLYATRSGHASIILREASTRYCGGGNQQAFFHLYLYRKEDEDVPLNWVLSSKMADYIWHKALGKGGNPAQLTALARALSVTQEAADSCHPCQP